MSLLQANKLSSLFVLELGWKTSTLSTLIVNFDVFFFISPKMLFVSIINDLIGCLLLNRAYPVYVNDYASGTQQQYYTTNDSYSATGNHQGETYIVPVEEALLASQSRESPQALSAVSNEHFASTYLVA